MTTPIDPETAARHRAFGDGVTSKDRRAIQLMVVRCSCRKVIATAYRWRDGRRYLWVPSHPMRLNDTGTFADVATQIADLDGNEDHWRLLTICRCGEGFLFTCHRSNANHYPEGAVVHRYSTAKGAADAFQAGEAVATWQLRGASEEYLLHGLVLRRLGKATAGEVAP